MTSTSHLECVLWVCGQAAHTAIIKSRSHLQLTAPLIVLLHQILVETVEPGVSGALRTGGIFFPSAFSPSKGRLFSRRQNRRGDTYSWLSGGELGMASDIERWY